jgi:hypothetical protein
VSLEAAIVTSLTCGVIVAVIGHDRGRGLWEVFELIVADRLHGIRLGEPDVCRSGTGGL